MKKHTLYILSIIAGIVLLASCNRWDDPEFQAPVYTGPAANHTIQDIKNMHTSLGTGAQDSICSWNEPFIVKAVVVSSDQGGNCYKYMTIQDETGGIEISIDRTGLYNEYPVGQTVYLDCRGLIVGDYHNKYQIGWGNRTSVQRINQEALGQYLHKDGLPDPNHPLIAHPIEITGTNQLTAENTNCLVRINGCKFDSKYIGQPLATNDQTMDREVYINGATVIVRTSNYANFRSTIIENKEYCLYGILSVYNSEYQLTLRTKEDIQDAINTQDILVQSLTINNNSLTTGGWSTSPNNDAWAFMSFQGDDFIYHNSATSNCDDWLISPEISLSSLNNMVLKVDHRNNVEGSPATYYQVYYSTTYNGGAFNEADWTAFNPNLNSYPSNFELSNELDLSVMNSNKFRIAFRYHKNGTADGTRWFIKGAKIFQKAR